MSLPHGPHHRSTSLSVQASGKAAQAWASYGWPDPETLVSRSGSSDRSRERVHLMFVSFLITAAKAIATIPMLQVSGLIVLATLALVCMGVLAWVAYECMATVVDGWQHERQRKARRASFRRRYGVRA